MSGQQIGTGVGFIAGFFLPGGPQVWAGIGGLIGGAISPTQIEGPRLTDGMGVTAQDGVPNPWGFGTFSTGVNVINAFDLREIREEDDGKGSGTEQVTYSYTRSFALGVCRAVRNTDGTYSDIAGVVRVTHNGKDIYNVLPDSTEDQRANNSKFLEKFTIYLGGDSQLPDPTLVAYLGVDNASAYRGQVYIVGTDIDQTEARGAMGTWEVVVAMGGSSERVVTFYPADFDIRSFVEVDPETGDMAAITYDGTDRMFGLGGGIPVTYQTTNPIQPVGIAWSPLLGKFATTSDANNDQYYTSLAGSAVWNLHSSINLFVERRGMAWSPTLGEFATTAGPHLVRSSDGITYTYITVGIAGAQTIKWSVTANAYITTGGETYVSNAAGTSFTDASLVSTTYMDIADSGSEISIVGGASEAYSNDGSSWTERSVPINFNCVEWCEFLGRFVAAGPLSTAPFGGFGIYTREEGGLWELEYQVVPASNDPWDIACCNVTQKIYFAANNSGGPSTPNGGLHVMGAAQIITPGAVTLASIVSEVCRRSGLESSDIDVSSLTQEVKGFKVSTETTGEAIIASLMPGYFFDVAEWDDKVRFVPRGGAPVFDLVVDDLVERDGPIIEETEVQEVELLRKAIVHTMDPDSGYVEVPQSWERRAATVAASGEQTLQLPVVMSRDEARQTAHKRIKVAWTEVRRFLFELPYTRPELTPTDCGTITDRSGRQQRIRLEDMVEDSGIIEIREAKLDRQSAYSSNVTGVQHGQRPTTTPQPPGPTFFWAGNLPSLRSSDNTPGMYVAAAGYQRGWHGASIFLSTDNGLSFQRVIEWPTASRMGVLTSNIDSDDEPIQVFMNAGTLSTVTDDQIANRANAFAITTVGSDGAVSEIGQFQTAALTSTQEYDLTDTFRGGLGTEATSHLLGDPFVMLGSTVFLPIDISHAGRTLIFKAVSYGRTLDDTAEYPVVFQPLFTNVVIEAYVNEVGETYVDGNGSTYYRIT